MTANNYTLIRLADVILWAAEAEAETGSLTNATALVNQVRSRAANPAGFVKKADGSPAANYKIGLYPTFTDKTLARKAIHFERKLELAMEGHRFFDVVRWGEAAQTLNGYLAYESIKRTYLKGTTFQAGADEYFPIPQAQIDRSSVGGKSTIVQNPGY